MASQKKYVYHYFCTDERVDAADIPAYSLVRVHTATEMPAGRLADVITGGAARTLDGKDIEDLLRLHKEKLIELTAAEFDDLEKKGSADRKKEIASLLEQRQRAARLNRGLFQGGVLPAYLTEKRDIRARNPRTLPHKSALASVEIQEPSLFSLELKEGKEPITFRLGDVVQFQYMRGIVRWIGGDTRVALQLVDEDLLDEIREVAKAPGFHDLELPLCLAEVLEMKPFIKTQYFVMMTCDSSLPDSKPGVLFAYVPLFSPTWNLADLESSATYNIKNPSGHHCLVEIEIDRVPFLLRIDSRSRRLETILSGQLSLVVKDAPPSLVIIVREENDDPRLVDYSGAAVIVRCDNGLAQVQTDQKTEWLTIDNVFDIGNPPTWITDGLVNLKAHEFADGDIVVAILERSCAFGSIKAVVSVPKDPNRSVEYAVIEGLKELSVEELPPYPRLLLPYLRCFVTETDKTLVVQVDRVKNPVDKVKCFITISGQEGAASVGALWMQLKDEKLNCLDRDDLAPGELLRISFDDFLKLKDKERTKRLPCVKPQNEQRGQARKDHDPPREVAGDPLPDNPALPAWISDRDRTWEVYGISRESAVQVGKSPHLAVIKAILDVPHLEEPYIILEPMFGDLKDINKEEVPEIIRKHLHQLPFDQNEVVILPKTKISIPSFRLATDDVESSRYEQFPRGSILVAAAPHALRWMDLDSLYSFSLRAGRQLDDGAVEEVPPHAVPFLYRIEDKRVRFETVLSGHLELLQRPHVGGVYVLGGGAGAEDFDYAAVGTVAALENGFLRVQVGGEETRTTLDKVFAVAAPPPWVANCAETLRMTGFERDALVEVTGLASRQVGRVRSAVRLPWAEEASLVIDLQTAGKEQDLRVPRCVVPFLQQLGADPQRAVVVPASRLRALTVGDERFFVEVAGADRGSLWTLHAGMLESHDSGELVPAVARAADLAEVEAAAFTILARFRDPGERCRVLEDVDALTRGAPARAHRQGRVGVQPADATLDLPDGEFFVLVDKLVSSGTVHLAGSIFVKTDRNDFINVELKIRIKEFRVSLGNTRKIDASVVPLLLKVKMERRVFAILGGQIDMFEGKTLISRVLWMDYSEDMNHAIGEMTGTDDGLVTVKISESVLQTTVDQIYRLSPHPAWFGAIKGSFPRQSRVSIRQTSNVGIVKSTYRLPWVEEEVCVVELSTNAVPPGLGPEDRYRPLIAYLWLEKAFTDKTVVVPESKLALQK